MPGTEPKSPALIARQTTAVKSQSYEIYQCIFAMMVERRRCHSIAAPQNEVAADVAKSACDRSHADNAKDEPYLSGMRVVPGRNWSSSRISPGPAILGAAEAYLFLKSFPKVRTEDDREWV